MRRSGLAPAGAVPDRPREVRATRPLPGVRLGVAVACLAGFSQLVACDVPADPGSRAAAGPDPEVTLALAQQLVGPEGEVSWDRYHTSREAHAIMWAFHQRHPDLTELYSIGESWEGRDLWVMEITNQATGPASEKPALYVDGGIHAQELTASEVALYLIAHLLNGYGEDEQVTALLDERAFYVRPKFNPDGSDLVLEEDQWLRSTVRPVDSNEDGTPDSDPPEDLTGNGLILQMRIPDDEGQWRKADDDPRIMVRREEGDEGPFYRLEREGRDLNRDGVINSDGIGGIDMNRNFPWSWQPVYRQPGAYNYPLSEPETRAAAEFVNENRNITGIVHGHTSGGFIYRLPSATDPTQFDETDLELIIELGDWYTRDTGRPVVQSARGPGDHRFGTFISMGYWVYGIIGWVPEYSPGPAEWVPDYDGTGEVTEADWHRFNEEEFGGRYFTDWEPFEHPDLGPVEIGGWHTKYWGQNPPHDLLEDELAVQVPWILDLAERSPLLEMDEPVVRHLGERRYEVIATVTNTGYLPTHLTQRGFAGEAVAVGAGGGEVAGAGAGVGGAADADPGWRRNQIVRSPMAVLEVEGGRVIDGSGRARIGHLAGSNPFTDAVTERSRQVRWAVEREADDATIQVTVSAEKAGTARSGRIRLAEGAGS